MIEDLDRYPDWTLRIANAPRTISVSKEFAEQNRDVIVALLRAAIRAGRWINANPDAAADIFYRTTIYADRDEIAKALRGYDLVPNLSAQNLAGLAIEKKFLLDHNVHRQRLRRQRMGGRLLSGGSPGGRLTWRGAGPSVGADLPAKHREQEWTLA